MPLSPELEEQFACRSSTEWLEKILLPSLRLPAFASITVFGEIVDQDKFQLLDVITSSGGGGRCGPPI